MKFSIIIPTYNRINLLEKAIESVNRQTYKEYEIIVVNDNPKDKSSVDKLVKKFDKVTVIHHTYSQGGSAARNSGMLNSNGKLIAFLDDDDIWLPDKLSMHLKKHEENVNAGLIFSDVLYVYNNPFIKDRVKLNRVPSNLIKAMGKGFCPNTSSIVSIKRECIERCGLFDEKLVSFEDWDFWFRIAHVFEFSHVPEVLVHYNQHLGDRNSQSEITRRMGLDQICNKWGNKIDSIEFKKKFIGSVYYKNSRNALMAGEKFSAFKKSLKLLNLEVISKRTVRNFIKIILVILTKR